MQGKEDAKSSLKQIKRAMGECALPEIEILMSGLSILQVIDQREILRDLKIPVLMIFAERDTLVPAAVAEQCQLLSKQIDLEIIPEQGIFLYYSPAADVKYFTGFYSPER